MYPILLFLHSLVRWLVVASLTLAIYRGFRGWRLRLPFGKPDNTIRHIAATMCHIQLMLGYVLYFNSPFIAYIRAHFGEAVRQFDLLFFGVIHISLMTVAIIMVTIASSVAKRQQEASAQFRTMAIFYLIALLIILIAVPWPFSPLSARPYLRTF